jgi:hypothetical protein
MGVTAGLPALKRVRDMKKLFLMAAAAAAFAAVPASAITVVSTACISVADANGCKFDGNIAPNTVAATQAAYNLYNNSVPSANPDIVLNFLGKSDDVPPFGTTTGGGGTSGTWATPGFLVDFLAVKAGNFFVLYKLAAPTSSGSWNTFNITNRNGNPLDLSHLTFFGGKDPNFDPDGTVPEPATWAMLLSGFGMVGFAARRRRGLNSVSA